MDLYDLAGRAALGSRLRRLSGILTEDAAAIYQLYGVPLDARWFPVFYALARQGPRSIGDLARAVGQSHAAVSQVVTAMRRRGLVSSRKARGDARVRVVALTPAGEAAAEKLADQVEDVGAAVDQLEAEATHDLWAAVEEMEQLLERRDLASRVRDRFRQRRSDRVQIEDFRDPDAADFLRLNMDWIERHFEVEEKDLLWLREPRRRILDPGGHIFMARLDDEAIGTVALIPMEGGGFELAKMAVAPRAQGLGIGERLGRAALEWARHRGAPRVFLESNRTLTPALSLYRKLGFREVVGPPSPYARADIQMQLDLDA